MNLREGKKGAIEEGPIVRGKTAISATSRKESREQLLEERRARGSLSNGEG